MEARLPGPAGSGIDTEPVNGEQVPSLAAAQLSACTLISFETRRSGALDSRHEAEVCPLTGSAGSPEPPPISSSTPRGLITLARILAVSSVLALPTVRDYVHEVRGI